MLLYEVKDIVDLKVQGVPHRYRSELFFDKPGTIFVDLPGQCDKDIVGNSSQCFGGDADPIEERKMYKR